MKQANAWRKAKKFNARRIAKENRIRREKEKKKAQTRITKATGHYPTYYFGRSGYVGSW